MVTSDTMTTVVPHVTPCTRREFSCLTLIGGRRCETATFGELFRTSVQRRSHNPVLTPQCFTTVSARQCHGDLTPSEHVLSVCRESGRSSSSGISRRRKVLATTATTTAVDTARQTVTKHCSLRPPLITDQLLSRAWHLSGERQRPPWCCSRPYTLARLRQHID